MKLIKSALALMLALSFVFVLVACGGEDNTQTPTTTAAALSAEQNSENISDTAKTNDTSAKQSGVQKTTIVTTKKVTRETDDPRASKTADLITRTTNKKGNATAAFVKSLKGYNLKVYYPWQPESKGSVTKLKQSALDSMKAVMDEFGVTITEDGKFEGYNDALTANLTSGKVDSQVYMVQGFNYASYFKNGYLTDLTQAMNTAGVDFKDPWYVQDAIQFFNVNYKQYAWIAFDAEYVFPSICIVYNKTLLKKARLTDPAILAKQGKWTWDTIVKYAKKLDSANVVGWGCQYDMNPEVLAQKGTSFLKVQKGKEPVSNLLDQKVKDSLATVYKWTKNGEICDTFKDKNWTYGKIQMAAGKVALFSGGHDAIQALRTNKQTKDDFGVVQFPTEKGTTTYTNVASPSFPCFIPTKFKKDAAKILFLRNEMYRQNYRYAQRNFTYQWKTYFDDTEVLEYACNIKYGRNGNKTVFDWSSVCLPQNAKANFSNVVSHVYNNNGDVQGAITKYNDVINKALKDVWSGYKITGKV